MSVCDSSVVTLAFANDVLARVRESLRQYLRDRHAAGSFVGVTRTLLSAPCLVPGT